MVPKIRGGQILFWNKPNQRSLVRNCEHYLETIMTEDRGFRAILALISPPVPVWQHKPDCPTPYQWDAKNEIVVMPWY